MSFLKKMIDISNDEYYCRCRLLGFFDLFSFQKNAKERYLFKLFGLRFTISKKRLTPEEIIEMNSKYEQGSLEGLSVPDVRTSKQTLEELVNTNKSICRYGDGEFNLVFGEDLPFQVYDKRLASKMREILLSNDEGIMVAIPDVFTSLMQYNDGGVHFWRKYITLHRQNIYNVLDMNKVYFDTQVTRAYDGVRDKSFCEQHFENFKKIWKDRDVVIVEGAGSRLGVGNDLFNGVKSIKRILCPPKNAFEKYDEILEICAKLPKNSLFLLALGPTATVLAYDLAKLGYRALDLGHLDIEYEWMLKKANKKIAIEGKYVNEVKGGRKVLRTSDKKYLSEILENLSGEKVEEV